KENLDKLKSNLRLFRAELSATVRDTIYFTERLGEKYLRVDALCIMSDDATVRQQTISDMDRIYAGSLFTIVAGACASAD
ncbi:hypothetical protein EJ02DRAFT_326195, partial [Clathrospora elynae]